MMLEIRKPKKKSRKGENGRLLIIGGSRKYCGAAIFNILGARRFVDLIYFFPGEHDPYLIWHAKSIPETIVMEKEEEIEELIKKVDCVLFGSGIDNANFEVKLLKKAKKIVVDGDGLKKINKEEMNKKFLITPHEGEFRRMFGCEGNEKNVKKMAKKYGCTILKKGWKDIVSDGKELWVNEEHDVGLTKGGTGDVLAGVCGAFYSKNPAMKSAKAASILVGKTSLYLKKLYGHNYCASDLAESLAHIAAVEEKI